MQSRASHAAAGPAVSGPWHQPLGAIDLSFDLFYKNNVLHLNRLDEFLYSERQFGLRFISEGVGWYGLWV